MIVDCPSNSSLALVLGFCWQGPKFVGAWKSLLNIILNIILKQIIKWMVMHHQVEAELEGFSNRFERFGVRALKATSASPVHVDM